MTDTLTEDQPAPRTKNCEQCGAEFVPANNRQRFCDEHTRSSMRRKDSAPPSIKIQMGAGKSQQKKGDPALERVEERARQFAGLLAVVILMAGSPADAADVERGADEWAKSVRNLAQFEPWLKKLAAGGEEANRVMAWLQFAMATLGIALPIMNRHGQLPEPIARAFSMAATQMPNQAPNGAEPTHAEHAATAA